LIVRIAAFTPRGAALAARVADGLAALGAQAQAFASPGIAKETGLPSTTGISAWTRECFAKSDALVYIGAAGIAVRAIAPHIASKHTDPAVLCMDEGGAYVIPLLSGHEGGANRLAESIARMIGAAAVVTTATDVNGCFAVDEWIARNGFTLIHLENVSAFAMAELRGEKPGLSSDFPVEGRSADIFGENGDVGLYVGPGYGEPFSKTVQAVPAVVTAGIGCRRGTDASAIRRAIQEAFSMCAFRTEALEGIASIDLKQDEKGLFVCAEQFKVPLRFFPAETLKQAEGSFTASPLVERVTGVDNVCERAAVSASGGRLVLKKQIIGGVTVALAMREITIKFTGENQ